MRIPERVRAIELPQFDLLNDVAALWRARGADVITLGQALPGFAPPKPAPVEPLIEFAQKARELRERARQEAAQRRVVGEG